MKPAPIQLQIIKILEHEKKPMGIVEIGLKIKYADKTGHYSCLREPIRRMVGIYVERLPNGKYGIV